MFTGADHPLLTPGRFVVGCNYWASHAGTNMWRDWQPEVVADDLARLAAAGLQVLRVFPLWPDFQPIALLRGGHGHAYEVRWGEEPLSNDELGRAGLSAVMCERFAAFCELARAQGLQLLVGLLTGWMIRLVRGRARTRPPAPRRERQARPHRANAV
jgi:endo-1,4-beta-mannosidase